jgi:putative ABC transport system permease protein
MRAGQRQRARLVGVTEAHFAGGRVAFKEGGAFTPIQIQDARPVAIIGQAVENRLFPRSQAIGQQIKCGALWLTVVGVLEERALSQDNIDKLGLRDYNFDVYTPITTTLRRVENRARVTRRDLQAAARDRSENDDDANVSQAPSNYHQLDRLVVRADSPELVAPVAEVVGRMLKRRHNDVEDVQVLVPEQLLAQEQRTQTIFNLVLAAIASISLIVGGIGIMNIMLASVLERIREIGLRRAVGATERDIVVQFLIEALTISLGGGLLGIGLGLGISAVIEALTGIPTLVSGTSIAVSFVVSAGVGLVFGLLPARRAAERDPVEALRYE